MIRVATVLCQGHCSFTNPYETHKGADLRCLFEGDRVPISVTWKVLLGFMNESEATEYTTRQGVQLSEAELKDVQDRARGARDYVKKLPKRGGHQTRTY